MYHDQRAEVLLGDPCILLLLDETVQPRIHPGLGHPLMHQSLCMLMGKCQKAFVRFGKHLQYSAVDMWLVRLKLL